MISTKGRYAIRVMVDMAEQRTDAYIPLNEIAERQGVSIKYLEIILKSLVKEKLLKGRRGKGGGYKLTREPKGYTIAEILGLTEGPLAPVACLVKGADPCERRSACRTYDMWKRFEDIAFDFFNNITIADLMKDEEKLLKITSLKKSASKKCGA